MTQYINIVLPGVSLTTCTDDLDCVVPHIVCFIDTCNLQDHMSFKFILVCFKSVNIVGGFGNLFVCVFVGLSCWATALDFALSFMQSVWLPKGVIEG